MQQVLPLEQAPSFVAAAQMVPVFTSYVERLDLSATRFQGGMLNNSGSIKGQTLTYRPQTSNLKL